MLPSLTPANDKYGHKKVHLARECGVNSSTFYKWVTGRSRCPSHKRPSVERAFGAPVDWVQYDLECDFLLGDQEDHHNPRALKLKTTTRRDAQALVGDHTPANDPLDAFSSLYGDCI